MERCQHSVYVIPSDWQVQAEWRIPPPMRIAWYCWVCREYGDFGFSFEKLKRLAMANCEKNAPFNGNVMLPLRKTDTTILIKNADLEGDAPEHAPDVLPELIDEEQGEDIPLDEAA